MTHRIVPEFLELARRHRLAGLALLVAGLAVPLLVGEAATAGLRYDRALIAEGQWWRLVSAHLVHYDARHWLMNLAGLALLWWLFVADLPVRAWWLVAGVAALAVSGGLYLFAPGVGWYVGLSGVLHGVWAAAGVAAWRRWRLESGVTLALLAGKLLLERSHGPVSAGLDPGLTVITVAHLYGALGGLAAALGLGFARRSL